MQSCHRTKKSVSHTFGNKKGASCEGDAPSLYFKNTARRGLSEMKFMVSYGIFSVDVLQCAEKNYFGG